MLGLLLVDLPEWSRSDDLPLGLCIRWNSGSTESASNNRRLGHLVLAQVVVLVVRGLRDLPDRLDHLDLHAERQLLLELRWAVVGPVAGRLE